MATRRYLAEVESWLYRLYIEESGAGLRLEDRRKAIEVAALLEEIERVVARAARKKPFVLVDAAAGKSYIGLLAAKLVLEKEDRPSFVTTLECVPERVAISRRAAALLDSKIPVECIEADIAAIADAANTTDRSHWPQNPSLVVALHACGGASDTVIDRSVVSGAHALLLVPCCTGKSVAAATRALEQAERLGIPRQAAVRRRFLQAVIDAERTWRLEAAGYETEVVEFVAPTVTPHNLLWRSRRVGEPKRMAAARAALERFHSLTSLQSRAVSPKPPLSTMLLG